MTDEVDKGGRRPGSKNVRTLERMNQVEELMLSCTSDRQIWAMKMAEWKCTVAVVKRIIRYIRLKWIEEEESRRPGAKSAAIARLGKMSNQLHHDPKDRVPVERLRAELEGTLAPTRVEQSVQFDLATEGRRALDLLATTLGVDSDPKGESDA